MARLSAGRGFTLIEAVFAVTVVGVLATVATWQAAPVLERAKMRRAASTVATDLQYAQLMAARDRKPVAFILIPSAKAYLIRSRNDTTTIYRQRFLGPDTEFAARTFSASPSNVVEIFPNGVATRSTTFSIGREGAMFHVQITRAGLIRALR